MHPGAVFSDIGNFDEKGIDSGSFDRFSEGFEVHVRRAGGNDDGIETEFGNFLMDELLTGFAAHVFVVHGTVYAGHFSNFFGNFFAVHGTSDIFAAPTSKNADFHENCVKRATGVLYRALRNNTERFTEPQSEDCESETTKISPSAIRSRTSILKGR